LWAERVNRSRGIVKAQLKQGEDAALGKTHSAWGGQGRATQNGQFGVRHGRRSTARMARRAADTARGLRYMTGLGNARVANCLANDR
jgi:hypothetical protein